MDVVSYSIVIEEISRVCANTGVILSVNNSLVCDPIEKYGNDDQKKRFLEPLARGEKLGCFALTEPNAGSDAANQQTRAVREGDHYRISGQKVFITCGQAADLCLLFAMTDPEKKARGISAFVVDTEAPGFDRSRHQVKLGVNASGTVEIFLTDVMVPVEDRLGKEGEGFKIAMSTLDGGRIGIAAQVVDRTEALRPRIAYAKSPLASASPSPICGDPLLPADMATGAGRRPPSDAAAAAKDTAAQRRPLRVEAAWPLYAAEMAQRVTTKALQHGGYGYTKGYPVERIFRDARITEIYDRHERDPQVDHRERDLREAGVAI
jgi:butyryl-CoA dehydrogenase